MSSASKMVPEEVAGSSRGARECGGSKGARASTSRSNANVSFKFLNSYSKNLKYLILKSAL